jgi:hypothetical protein
MLQIAHARLAYQEVQHSIVIQSPKRKGIDLFFA